MAMTLTRKGLRVGLIILAFILCYEFARIALGYRPPIESKLFWGTFAVYWFLEGIFRVGGAFWGNNETPASRA